MVLFYIDGEQVTSTKAKALYVSMCNRHGYSLDHGSEAQIAWARKSKEDGYKDYKEFINNITESLLEIVVEDN